MAGKLKPLDVERETKPGKYADGGGLYLIVASTTAKNWSYRYWIDGKERWHGLGSFRELSLKEARLARDAARLRVKGDRSTPGVDIVAERRAARQRTQAAEIAAAAPTFQQCAEKYIDAQWSGWSEKHRAQWPASLKRYAYPTIGGLTIADIRPSHIYDLLAPIWIEKRETANRVRGRIETIIAKNTDINDLDFRNPPSSPSSCVKSYRSGLSGRSATTPPCPMLTLQHSWFSFGRPVGARRRRRCASLSSRPAGRTRWSAPAGLKSIGLFPLAQCGRSPLLRSTLIMRTFSAGR
jgi:Arm DNA-binding domain